MPEKHHVAVNLVGDDRHTAAVAQLRQPLQYGRRPCNAGRIVRIRQDQQPAVGIAQQCFELFEIHFITVVRTPQRIVENLPAHVLRHKPERMIHRRLDDDLLPGLRESLHDHADSLDNAGDEPHP